MLKYISHIKRGVAMESVLLVLTVLSVSLQSVARKAYNQKKEGGAFTFTAASILFALLVFLIAGKGRFELDAGALWYSLFFALSYSAACVSTYLAIRESSLSLTSLIVQYSLIIPAFYGLIVLNEPISLTLTAGLVLLCISLVLVNFEGSEEKKITLKWGLFAFLSFAGNGVCSTVQKAQQIRFDGMYKSEFMIIALFISAVLIFALAFITEKNEVKEHLKKGVIYYVLCGVANGLTNFFVLILSNTVPASVMFPIIAAGGIVLTALISIFFYREKLSLQQKIGFVLGILAIILMNI